MKKRIFISVTFIAVAVIYVDAQSKSITTDPPAISMESFVAVPPPPPPIPPVPPTPPAPPYPPTETVESNSHEFTGTEIINSNGYEISVRSINRKAMVIAKKDGKTQKIKLSTWNANRKYYEKKYGQLPPPPPPSVPVIEELEFAPPVIKKDN